MHHEHGLLMATCKLAACFRAGGIPKGGNSYASLQSFALLTISQFQTTGSPEHVAETEDDGHACELSWMGGRRQTYEPRVHERSMPVLTSALKMSTTSAGVLPLFLR